MRIDKLALQFFDKPEHFGAAMKLIYEDAKAWGKYRNFPEYEEHFLSNIELDTFDDYLYKKGGKFKDHINGEVSRLQNENEFLREALLNSKHTSTIADQEGFLDKILETINPPISDSDNPTLAALFDRWVRESTMREISLNDTYKPVIELFIKYINDLHVGDARINVLGSLDCTFHRRAHG